MSEQICTHAVNVSAYRVTACGRPAKWWFRRGPTDIWAPACGIHARVPPCTTKERKPITEPK